jgi:radical SAM protein with 4Fe4S-binding SPASM domain
MVVIWEATRACSLACRHCRASAMRHPAPDELAGEEAKALLRQVAAIQPAIFVITGGDPLERADLFELVAYARGLGLGVSLAPSATPLLDRAAVERLAALGCRGVQLSLDGADAATHDRFRGHSGTFARTLQACQFVRAAGLPLTVATTVTRWNVEQLADIYQLVQTLEPVRWSVFFLVPTGRARWDESVAPEVAEAVLLWLHMLSREAPFTLKTTEAPQVRRFLAADPGSPPEAATVADGRGFVFVSAAGDITPSGFLPLPAGNVRRDDLLQVYREHPLFRSLRDPDALRGPRCRRCSYRRVCGGSRSRAYAATGDPLGDDPLCAYVPPEGISEATGGVPQC